MEWLSVVHLLCFANILIVRFRVDSDQIHGTEIYRKNNDFSVNQPNYSMRSYVGCLVSEPETSGVEPMLL